jgi:uncharacterized protein
MIVVLDTNVCVSALQFAFRQGVPVKALSRAVNDDVIATRDPLEAELLRILTERFHWPSPRANQAIRRMFESSIRVRVFGTVKVCRDAGDDMVLECAERADAELMVTGDKDLLVIGAHKQARIVTPAEYLAE